MTGIIATAPQFDQPKQKTIWPRDLVFGLLPLLLGFQLLLAIVYLPLGLKGLADFRQLYTGGYMIRTGHAAQLYDYDSQQHFEETLVPVGAHFLLPINHLAYEELLFVPLSALPYRTAYFAFLVFNCILLMLCAWLLTSTLKDQEEARNWFPAVLILGFCPISRAMLQGQDSIIMLVLLAAAFWLLKHERELPAGLLLGVGAFKFQIAIPIALLFLIWRRWRFSIGFAISSVAAGAVSLWIIGLNGARQYLSMLLSMSLRLNSDADMLRYCTIPSEMLNVRGLASAIFDGILPHSYIQIMIAISSLAILALAARQRPSLPLAITAASLVSYHFIAHDASILVIVIGAVFCMKSVALRLAAVALLIAPFSAMIPRFGYVAAIPLLLLFVLMLVARESGASDVSSRLLGTASHAGI